MFETNASELASFGRSGGLAIGAAVGLLAAFAAGLHLEGRFKRWLIPVVVVAITLAPALGVIVSGRDLSKLNFLAEVSAGGLEAWIYRLATGGVVFLASVRLIARVLRPTHEALPGLALYAAFMGYWLTNLLLPGLFGTVPALSVSMIYPALVASALFASRHYDVDDLMLAAKWALFVFLALSFVAFFVTPNLATQFGKVEARLPGVNFRLWGLSSGPNAYGPLGLLLILMVVHKPFRFLAVSIAAVVVGGFALVLAQSQTTWGAAAIVLPPFIAYRIRHRRGTRRRRREQDAGGLKAGRLLFAIGLAVLAVAVFAVLSAQFGVGKGMVSDFGNAMEASRKGREISDLSGRTQIWFIAFEVFKQNPLFGYGPTLWSNEFRMAWRVPFAFHAHNQFMQSLGVGGLVGLLGLLIYVSTLGAMALKVARASRGWRRRSLWSRSCVA
ncbi:MAG: O-antigen ligase family protein [Burkholderiaceae bacterium]